MIYLYLFLEFFKIGLFTIGGGYAMIPLMRETVLKHDWMGEEKFYDFDKFVGNDDVEEEFFEDESKESIVIDEKIEDEENLITEDNFEEGAFLQEDLQENNIIVDKNLVDNMINGISATDENVIEEQFVTNQDVDSDTALYDGLDALEIVEEESVIQDDFNVDNDDIQELNYEEHTDLDFVDVQEKQADEVVNIEPEKQEVMDDIEEQDFTLLEEETVDIGQNIQSDSLLEFNDKEQFLDLEDTDMSDSLDFETEDNMVETLEESKVILSDRELILEDDSNDMEFKDTRLDSYSCFEFEPEVPVYDSELICEK